MRARLQRDDQGRAAYSRRAVASAGPLQRDDLGVRTAHRLRLAASEDAIAA
jgi:hypothetical protein